MNHFASLSPKKLGSYHHLLELLRSHWSIGIHAPALTAHLVLWSASSDPLCWLLPSWVGYWQQHQCRQQTSAQPSTTQYSTGNFTRTEAFQLVDWMEHLWLNGEILLRIYSSSKQVLFPKRLNVGITGKGTQYPGIPQHKTCTVF